MTHPVSLGLAPLGWIYGALMRLRRQLFAGGIRSALRVSVPVISVGNLTLGGTGKTPFVAYLACYLQEQGYRVALLSRGYGRTSRGLRVVCTGQGPILSWQEAGDEPFLLARWLPWMPIIVDGDRRRAADYALRHFASDVLLLDDGFQHLSLQRDLDLVLIDSTQPLRSARVLPAGRLREPLTALCAAHMLVLTRTDQVDSVAPLRASLADLAPARPVVESVLQVEALVDLDETRVLEPPALTGKRVVTVAAIGNPTAFEKTVEDLGACVVHRFRFRDHHPFRPGDLRLMMEAAHRHQAEAVITTEKDAVRLAGWSDSCPLWILRIKLRITRGAELVEQALQRLLVR